MEEFDVYDNSSSVFGAGMEGFVTVDKMGPERVFSSFSGKALCTIKDKGGVRLSSPEPIKGDPKKIVYSPHLLYDSGHGLYNTETSLSSLSEQKSQDEQR